MVLFVFYSTAERSALCNRSRLWVRGMQVVGMDQEDSAKDCEKYVVDFDGQARIVLFCRLHGLRTAFRWLPQVGVVCASVFCGLKCFALVICALQSINGDVLRKNHLPKGMALLFTAEWYGGGQSRVRPHRRPFSPGFGLDLLRPKSLLTRTGMMMGDGVLCVLRLTSKRRGSSKNSKTDIDIEYLRSDR